MRRLTLTLTFSLLALMDLFLTGCGQDAPSPAVPVGTTTGPHGGIAVPLPDGAGYAEILLEKEGPSKGKSRAAAKGVKPRFVVFFLNPDRNGPASPAPGEAQLKVNLPTGSTASVVLTASPKTDDPSGSARFLSEPGDYDYDELSGELSATLGGQASSVTFALR